MLSWCSFICQNMAARLPWSWLFPCECSLIPGTSRGRPTGGWDSQDASGWALGQVPLWASLKVQSGATCIRITEVCVRMQTPGPTSEFLDHPWDKTRNPYFSLSASALSESNIYPSLGVLD